MNYNGVLPLTTHTGQGQSVAMPNTDPLLTATEVAEKARVHPETVRRWTRDGLLKAITLPGGHLRYDPEEVNALLTSGTAA